MTKRRPELYRTRFGGFVMRVGAGPLADLLGEQGFQLTEKAIYRWLTGATAPGTMVCGAIERASRGRVRMQDVERHIREVRHGDGAGHGGAGDGAPAVAAGAQERAGGE